MEIGALAQSGLSRMRADAAPDIAVQRGDDAGYSVGTEAFRTGACDCSAGTRIAGARTERRWFGQWLG
jgi:hypothetical protein